ncbi:hypothetical protein, partial [Pseudomonas sp. SIMBA_067]|uniref:hypothetical protein n=1 Tax=Pseudomonas sp. SIMBA_067 TaxID=3085807 RepID=UPI0039784BA5
LLDPGGGIALVLQAVSLHMPDNAVALPLDAYAFSREIGFVEKSGQAQRADIAKFIRCVREAVDSA